MPSEPVSVAELRDYWDHFKALKDGDIVERYVATSEMPRWAVICAAMPWRLYRLGRFTQKTTGMAAYTGS
jgi:hypothetical protein